MKITAYVSIAYSNIFDDYDKIEIKTLLNNIPSKSALEVVGHFSAQIHSKERDSRRQIEFLKIWLARLPNSVHKRINELILKLAKESNVRINFINNITNCLLSEHILANHNSLDRVSNLTPEQELDLFKAYLWCSQQWTDKLKSKENRERSTLDQRAAFLIRMQFPYQELVEFKDFRMQFIKATFFFKFCESNEVFAEYLKIFYSEHKVNSWEEYLTFLLNIYIRKFEELKTSSITKINDDHKLVQEFVRQYCVDVADFKMSDDFLSLREKPVYEIENNSFLFLNLNLIVDKIFQGVQFALSKALIKNGARYKGVLIQRFDHFKSIYGEELSEKGLFYSIMESTFEKNDYIKIDGNTLKRTLKDGEPDFYIRDKNKIYLFEYKDVIINAQTKHSYDFKVIYTELLKKFVANRDGDAKGVTQLVNSIKKIQNGEFNAVDEIDKDNVIIYPIIIFTDYTLNIAGVNYLLNKEMRKIIANRKIDSRNVKNLVLIDIDILVKFQDLFRSKYLKINNCLNEYIEYTTIRTPEIKQLGTFNMFIHDKTSKLKDYTPSLLFTEASKLLSKG
ncbi:MAG: hypothetical protein HOP30_00095 [Cyclobacteriaceae bacterium]|nr:hypothetical protein [Cyclobacteriaceae bacterium]